MLNLTVLGLDSWKEGRNGDLGTRNISPSLQLQCQFQSPLIPHLVTTRHMIIQRESDECTGLESSRRTKTAPPARKWKTIGAKKHGLSSFQTIMAFVPFFLTPGPGNLRRGAGRVPTSAGVGVARPLVPIRPPGRGGAGRSHPVAGSRTSVSLAWLAALPALSAAA